MAKYQKKRDHKALEQLETKLYTLTENPIPDSFEAFVSSKIQNKYDTEEGFAAPNLPLNLLVNAHKSWLSFQDNEKVIAFIDSSIWNDGKEGIVFTNKRVLWKRSSFNTDYLSYPDIYEILNIPYLWEKDFHRYHNNSLSLIILSDLFKEDSDNETLMYVLYEISQKYQQLSGV